ncbi:MAG: YjfB family protein [Lachnospiraceae bacterium]|nr:YjfB family protein [Lachnospiraceae bacterium]
MDITSLSTSMSQYQLGNELGARLFGMTLDDVKAQAATQVAALDSMPGPALERSVNPAVGGNVDFSI